MVGRSLKVVGRVAPDGSVIHSFIDTGVHDSRAYPRGALVIGRPYPLALQEFTELWFAGRPAKFDGAGVRDGV